MRAIKQSAIVIGLACIYSLAGPAFAPVLSLGVTLFLAAVGGLVLTTSALAGCSMAAGIPSALMLGIQFLCLHPWEYPSHAFAIVLGLMIGSAAVLGALYMSTFHDDDSDESP